MKNLKALGIALVVLTMFAGLSGNPVGMFKLYALGFVGAITIIVVCIVVAGIFATLCDYIKERRKR